MREVFQRKRRGDSLAAAHVNRIGRVSRRVSAGSTGSYRSIQHTGSLDLTSNPPYHVQDVVVVSRVIDVSRKIYEVRLRYYDHASSQWTTNMETGPFFMDGSDTGNKSFKMGDKTDAFWHSQRSMYVPSTGGSVTNTGPDGELWCAKICECAVWRFGKIDPLSQPELIAIGEDEDTCCVYRGEIKRYVTPLETETTQSDETSDGSSSSSSGGAAVSHEALCEPRRTIRPVWIMADCQVGVGEGFSEGWARLVEEDVEIEWRPGTDVPFDLVDEDLFPTVKETLDVYEWCCWKPATCPNEEEGMLAVIRKVEPDGCDSLIGIEVPLEWRERDGSAHPVDAPGCNFDGWAGEFAVEATIPIQLVEAEYTVVGDSESRFGWIRPHWKTGEIVQVYRDENGDQVPEEEAIDEIISFGGCDLLISNDLDDEGLAIPYEETVTRWYRLKFDCDEDSATPVSGCLQHLYPPGHPIYEGANPGIGDDPSTLYATSDPEGLSIEFRACSNQIIAKGDFSFGNGHRKTDWWDPNSGPEGGDKYFAGTQYLLHTLAGCFDATEGRDCIFKNYGSLDNLKRPVNARVHIVVSW